LVVVVVVVVDAVAVDAAFADVALSDAQGQARFSTHSFAVVAAVAAVVVVVVVDLYLIKILFLEHSLHYLARQSHCASAHIVRWKKSSDDRNCPAPGTPFLGLIGAVVVAAAVDAAVATGTFDYDSHPLTLTQKEDYQIRRLPKLESLRLK